MSFPEPPEAAALELDPVSTPPEFEPQADRTAAAARLVAAPKK
jgi:hypothetical protein